ncbi:MAG: Rieske (2Fe-2S) protein [Solirubrobacterales bacterium]|jgi:nitrite reductase/ring-hydroxylating ferredoxin subunit
MSEWVKVAAAGDVAEGEINAYTVGNRTVAVANVDGDLQAFDDTCTHQGCSLSEGDLDGTIVECPCHGGRYDVMTGEVVGGPPPESVDVFDVVEEDGELRIRSRDDD